LQKQLYPDFAKKMTFIETPYGFEEAGSDSILYSIGYFGSFSSSVRNIMPLYSALKNIQCKSIIVGNGDQHISSIDNVTVLPRASVNEVMAYECQTRVLVCICNKLSKKGETGLIPGKAYHYGATTKEVLVVGATPKVKEFLEGYKRFYFVENDEKEIKATLDSLLRNEPKSFAKMEETIPQKAALKMLSEF
jgi:hypothetical protein